MFSHWLGVVRGRIHSGPVTAAHPCTANSGEEEKKTSKSRNEAPPLTAASWHMFEGGETANVYFPEVSALTN